VVAGGLRVITGGRIQTLPVGSLISVLDIGSSKTTCMIATVESGPQGGPSGHLRSLRMLGYGTTVSRGISGGAIANLEDAERSIRLAVDAAEKNARVRVQDVYVNVSCGKPRTQLVSAHVKIHGSSVSPRDVETCTAAALGKLELGRSHMLHVLPVTFAVDGVEAEDAPVGMHGDILSTEIAVVTLEPSRFHNLKMAIARAHLHPQGFVLSAMAAGRGVLTADEMSLGTAVIDMGGSLTDVAVFRGGRFVFSDSVAVGGAHVTNDVAHGLATTLAHAERLKTMFGTAAGFGHDDRELLAVPLLGERGVDSIHHVPRSALTAIIRPRIEETLEMVRDRLVASGAMAGISRIVLTGGASQLQGLRECASEIFGCVVRVAQPVGLQGISEQSLTGAMAVASGLLATAYAPERMLAVPEAARNALERANMGYARRLGRWLKEAL